MMDSLIAHKIMSLGYILFRRREEGPTFTKITLEIKPPIMVPFIPYVIINIYINVTLIWASLISVNFN